MAFTDHPEIDIKTHRSIANHLEWMAIILFGLAFASPIYVELAMTALLLTISVWVEVAAINMKTQALKWEVNDIHHGEQGQ